MGLKDILLAADLIDCKPDEICFFGIQTKDISMSMTLSQEVADNFYKLEDAVSKEIRLFITNATQESEQ